MIFSSKTYFIISDKPTDSLGRLQVMKMMTIPKQIRERLRSDLFLKIYRNLKFQNLNIKKSGTQHLRIRNPNIQYFGTQTFRFPTHFQLKSQLVQNAFKNKSSKVIKDSNFEHSKASLLCNFSASSTG